MNLEDFKSFRRVLIPPEVGSIPTHSRHFSAVAGLVLLAGVLGAGVPSRAGEPGRGGGAGEIPGPSPFQRAVRSAVFPAWGQVTNGKEIKGGILFGVQTYIYTRVLLETRRGKELERLAGRLEREGGDAGSIALAKATAQDHFDSRRNLLFWAILASFYGAVDAYVDAHLGEFEKELEEGRTLFSRVDPASRSAELGLRF